MPEQNPPAAAYSNLYIHVPFCSGKCDYCAFYSEGKDHSGMEPYTKKILAELDFYAPGLSGVRTVYLGGGTPTILRSDLLGRILKRLKEICPEAEEFSIECNPETLTEETAALLGEFVTRVSVGVQTFHPHLRQRIGRHSSPGRITEAFHLLHKNGLENLNCDLIYALPGETVEELEEDLKCAMDLGITHLSAYSLIVEESSVLQKRFDPGEEALNDHAALLEKELLHPFTAAHGFQRYEISNYARNTLRCSHNDRIWHGESYLGLGPAGCSFDGTDRYTQKSSLAKWLAGEAADCDRISRRSRLGEIFIMGLRTVRGWNDCEFENVTNNAFPADFEEYISKLRREGLMQKDRIALTGKGLDYWNDAAELFI